MLSVDRVILLVDLDAFYAAVEQVRLGLSADVPLAVQQWQGLIAVNYAARARGIIRHDRIQDAKQKCPELRLVHVETIGCDPGDVRRTSGKVSLERYRQASATVFRVFQRFTQLCERASIDEAYLDVTEAAEALVASRSDLAGEMADLREGQIVVLEGPLNLSNAYDRRLAAGAVVAARLQRAVHEELGYTISCGCACNKLLAKLVAGMNKPHRITVVPPRAVPALMKDLPLTKVRNLGGKLGKELQNLGCVTAGDVLRFEQGELAARFGDRLGAYVWKAVRGLHDEPVEVKGAAPKSMLAAKSFNPTSNRSDLCRWMGILARELTERMVRDAAAHARRPQSLHLSYRGPYPAVDRSKSCPMPFKASQLLLRTLAEMKAGAVHPGAGDDVAGRDEAAEADGASDVSDDVPPDEGVAADLAADVASPPPEGDNGTDADVPRELSATTGRQFEDQGTAPGTIFVQPGQQTKVPEVGPAECQVAPCGDFSEALIGPEEEDRTGALSNEPQGCRSKPPPGEKEAAAPSNPEAGPAVPGGVDQGRGTAGLAWAPGGADATPSAKEEGGGLSSPPKPTEPPPPEAPRMWESGPGAALAAVLQEHGLQLLERAGPGSIPCSRLALSAADFVALAASGSRPISAFFAAPGGATAGEAGDAAAHSQGGSEGGSLQHAEPARAGGLGHRGQRGRRREGDRIRGLFAKAQHSKPPAQSGEEGSNHQRAHGGSLQTPPDQSGSGHPDGHCHLAPGGAPHPPEEMEEGGRQGAGEGPLMEGGLQSPGESGSPPDALLERVGGAPRQQGGSGDGCSAAGLPPGRAPPPMQPGRQAAAEEGSQGRSPGGAENPEEEVVELERVDVAEQKQILERIAAQNYRRHGGAAGAAASPQRGGAGGPKRARRGGGAGRDGGQSQKHIESFFRP